MLFHASYFMVHHSMINTMEVLVIDFRYPLRWNYNDGFTSS